MKIGNLIPKLHKIWYNKKMIKRELSKKIRELKSKYPIILLTGPRQSGKTTLVKESFPNYTYKNLENPDEIALAIDDPKSFLNLGSKEKMIIDEIQKVPNLASYIQAEVDENKISSQFVLTGSQNFQISQTVSQSLAGRVANFELLPLSYTELTTTYNLVDLNKYILDGSYPRKYDKKISPSDFYRDYINTYITRDVRSLKNIGDLSNFQKFLQLLAGRVGQILNLNSLSNDLGVNAKTVESCISVLEASYIAFRLQPYFENFWKRVIKSPKIYFYDTGLICFLLGINTIDELKNHFVYGQLFENLIISEKLKNIWNKRANEKLYYWRDTNGNEVDLIIDKGLDKDILEIKSAKTYNVEMLKGLSNLASVMPEKYTIKSLLIYTGNIEQKIKSVNLINWKSFVEK